MQLTGKNVLITGGSAGLVPPSLVLTKFKGAECARKFAAEGCNIAINYANSTERAEKFSNELISQYPNVKIVVIQADVGQKVACEKLVAESISQLGGLDIIISNAGWTQFCPFSNLDFPEEAWDKCFAINIKAHVWLLRAALPTFQENADGGQLLITGSIAAHVVGGSSMAYAVTKAGQAHLMRCLAQSQGPKVKVNAVLPGLLLSDCSVRMFKVLTVGGLKYGETIIEEHKQLAPLKIATDMGDCADAFVMMAKNGSITGSALTIDAGISLMARKR